MLGHRGAAGLAPENTLISFHRGRTDGADVLELDVRATADGEVVVLHDATVDRTTDGTGPVRSLAWAELRTLDAGFRFTPDGGRTHPYRGQGVTVPRLVDLITALPDMPLNIEIKQDDPPIVAAVVAIVRRARVVVVLAAELDHVMDAIRQQPPICRPVSRRARWRGSTRPCRRGARRSSPAARSRCRFRPASATSSW